MLSNVSDSLANGINYVVKDGDGPGANRRLPLDALMQRKPMYHAIGAAFKRVPLY
jgi:hypothetical protein